MEDEKRLFANVEFNLETAAKMIANLVSQNANLQQKINNANKLIKILIKPKRQDNSFHKNPIYIAEMINLLEILGVNNESN